MFSPQLSLFDGAATILVDFPEPRRTNHPGYTCSLRYTYRLIPAGLEVIATSTPLEIPHSRREDDLLRYSKEHLRQYLVSIHTQAISILGLPDAPLNSERAYAPIGPWDVLPPDYSTDRRTRARWRILRGLGNQSILSLALHALQGMGLANITINRERFGYPYELAGREALADGYFRFTLPTAAEPTVVKETVREGEAMFKLLASS
jgi:hypothetical protein